MSEGDLRGAREGLLFALVLAGVTGDETFGELLDVIDRYVWLSVEVALRDLGDDGRS